MTEEIGILNYIMTNWQAWLAAATSIIGSAAIIATLTPNKSDDRIVQWLWDIINFVGANVGKAKNTGKE
jgi:site-specific recombinase